VEDQRTTSGGPTRWPNVAAVGVVGVFVSGLALTLTFWVLSGVIAGIGDLFDEMGLFIAFGLFAATGAMLIARVPQNRVGWILSGVALTVGVLPAAEAYAGYVMVARGAPDALATFGAWANGIYWVPLLAAVLIFVPLLFPDGRLPSPRWRRPVLVVVVSVIGITVMDMLRPDLTGQHLEYVIDNPIGVTGLDTGLGGVLFGVFTAGVACGVIMAVASTVVRFRRAGGAEREQLKWFFAAVALFVPLFAVMATLDGLGFSLPYVAVFLPAIVIGALPVAIGVAILRYRLYSIGRIVSRTISYALVTLVLAGIYVGTVLVLGGVIRALTGDDGALVVAASTLAAAAAFRPVRVRVQRLVDRRFSRARYDAAQMTEAFGRQLRDEIHLADATERLRRTATELLHPASASVLLLRPQTPDRS
jgi:hypothetical protein